MLRGETEGSERNTSCGKEKPRSKPGYVSMTMPSGNPEALWDNLLDNLQQFVEAQQNEPGPSPRDKNPNYIWNPPRPDRDGGSAGFPEDGGLPG